MPIIDTNKHLIFMGNLREFAKDDIVAEKQCKLKIYLNIQITSGFPPKNAKLYKIVAQRLMKGMNELYDYSN